MVLAAQRQLVQQADRMHTVYAEEAGVEMMLKVSVEHMGLQS